MPLVSYGQVPKLAPQPDMMYDVLERSDGPVDEDDYLHEPTAANKHMRDTSWRGVLNVSGKEVQDLEHMHLRLLTPCFRFILRIFSPCHPSRGHHHPVRRLSPHHTLHTTPCTLAVRKRERDGTSAPPYQSAVPDRPSDAVFSLYEDGA